MGLSFRTARKLWMGTVALLSLASIFLAVVLWVHGFSKSNNFGALIAIPCFAVVGAIWTISKKMFFSPQILCLEVTWVFALLPFQICKLLGLFAFEPDGALHSHFAAVYQALVALVWINSALVFLYTAGIVSLAVLTQLSCDDQEIWMRDIDSSPCPFPFQVLLVYAFPCVAKYFPEAAVELRSSAPTDYCLPGCPCQTKPAEASGSEAEGTDHTEGMRSSIPIRVPTAAERRSVIRVTLGHVTR